MSTALSSPTWKTRLDATARSVLFLLHCIERRGRPLLASEAQKIEVALDALRVGWLTTVEANLEDVLTPAGLAYNGALEAPAKQSVADLRAKLAGIVAQWETEPVAATLCG